MSESPETNVLDVEWCRAQFPALARRVRGQPAVYFDGPAGSQVPQRVIDAIGDYLVRMNANHGGLFETSRESDALLEEAHQGLADFLGTGDPETVAFGPNMTSLTFALSRSLSRTWRPGDEVVVSRLEHDANVTPWVLAARDAGATVRHVEFRHEDCTLDVDDLADKLTSRTRLVAVGCASNAVGTINPMDQIVRLAHDAGALVFFDAVHYAPHRLLEVDRWGCDFLVCSAYKFFGPHVGVMWGRRELLTELPAYKVRPAPDELPGRWMTGTQNHEGIAGTLAAVDYLADLGGRLQPGACDRRRALDATYRAIAAYEGDLFRELLAGLAGLPDVKIWGITDPERWDQRVPTVAVTHRRLAPRELAEYLAARGIFVWHGNYYALPVTEALGLEPDGMVRIGLLHYNTAEEVERLLAAMRELG
ncbi:MAG TPA: cysteine desulfurase-like protein [Thermoguttaceae bacterium]|nr:cysteine desulfurase-like protein [Thermoguttaceae bacterium]